MIREYFQWKETAVTILAEKEEQVAEAKKGILRAREKLEKYILRDPFFIHTLEPYEVPPDAPEIVKRMSKASREVGVGPMASVAGTIAEYGVRAMLSNTDARGIIDNGGDIAIYSPKRETRVGLYTGRPETSRFALLIPPKSRIVGVCTSSSTVGPSISFGRADAVTIISEDVALADAAATAVANKIKEKEDIKPALESLDDLREVTGAIAVVGKYFGLWGDVPEFLETDIDHGLITARIY